MKLIEIVDFLKSHGINPELINLDKYNFSRTIQFEIYGIKYQIIWFKNESTLRIGTQSRCAQIPFRYIYFDNTFPLVNENRSIGFAYTKTEKKSIFDREYPYEVFRIPLEIES